MLVQRKHAVMQFSFSAYSRRWPGASVFGPVGRMRHHAGHSGCTAWPPTPGSAVVEGENHGRARENIDGSVASMKKRSATWRSLPQGVIPPGPSASIAKSVGKR